MAQLPSNYDPQKAAESGNSFLMPKGEYVHRYASEEVKEAKSGRGSYLNQVWDCEQDGYEKRKQFIILNFWNDNETTVDIAYQTWAKQATAFGDPNATDTDKFVGERLIMVIGIRKNKNSGDEENYIAAYKPYYEGAESKPITTTSATSKPQVSNTRPPNAPPAGKPPADSQTTDDLESDLPF